MSVSLVACGGPEGGGHLTSDDGGPGDDGGRSDGGGGSGGKGKDDAGGGGGTGGGGATGMVRCSDLKCDTNASCDDSDGTPKCACNSGYSGDGMKCSDVDECKKDNGGCDDNAQCVNREGGYRCLCNETFTGDGKSCTGTNECDDVDLNTCDPNAACKDTSASFSCGACNAGYMSDNGVCTDLNECVAATAECKSNSTCRNTFGDYDCDCNPGFTGDGKTGCQDVCAGVPGTSGCDANALCQVDGSAVNGATGACTSCKPGYVGDGATCTAANDCPADCAAGTAKAHTVCTGDSGSRACACAPGFEGDPSAGCTDTDECNGGLGDCGMGIAGYTPDAAKDRCTNLPGGFACDCQAGYQKDEFGRCIDINECKAGEFPCHPNAACTNSAGSYTCTCKDGYEGDGKTCKDVDECKNGDANCLKDTARCVNTAGGFECRCLRGYTGDGVKSCKNVDECKDPDLNDCDEHATCTDASPKDNPIGYDCACEAGLGGDGTSCADINECKNASLFNCPKNATCMDKPGGFECVCADPFTGKDGACYCDLSGWWAMRQDVHTTWNEVSVSGVPIIKAGEQDSTAWELHKYTYDGESIKVEKKACGNDVDPDFVTTMASGLRETYCSYIPKATWYKLPLYKGRTIPEHTIVPGSMFTTPPEAAVAGIDLGPNPESATWPSDPSKVHDVGGAPPAWTDTDNDGEPGFTGWPHVPSEKPISSSTDDFYSYLPIDQNSTTPHRLVCSSSGTRVMGRLNVDVESCTKMTGTAESLRSEGYVRSCIRVDNAHKGNDFVCNQNAWTDYQGGTDRCTPTELDDLNSQANPDEAPVSTATFELIKIGAPDDDVDCADVIKALPAIKR